MAALSGRQELATFGEILTIDTSNSQVVDTTERPVVSGDGTASALKISTTTVSSTGLLIGRGTFGAGTDMPDSGARTGFYWYPKKAAILGGQVTGTQWDNASIGNYAIALGYNCTPSGASSVCIGTTSTASGSYSTVSGGRLSTASGNYSTVSGGYGSTASGSYSTVSGGQFNSATAMNSTVDGGNGNTASGSYSFIGGGTANTASGGAALIIGSGGSTASGNYSSVVGGFTNVASGATASCIGGLYGVADKHAQVVTGTGLVAGGMQRSDFILGQITTNATPTNLFLDGSSLGYLSLSNDSSWTFDILVSARRTDANDESAAYRIIGCIDRNASAATTALVGSITKTVIAEDIAAWDVTATADTTNGALLITVTGEAAKTIKWSAAVRTAETLG